jgi:hypothetical protein
MAEIVVIMLPMVVWRSLSSVQGRMDEGGVEVDLLRR